MLEPDWLIGQYKREAGIVNEAGILRLVCRAEVEQKDSKCSNSSAVLSVWWLESMKYSRLSSDTRTGKQTDIWRIAKEAETKFGISPVNSMPYKVC